MIKIAIEVHRQFGRPHGRIYAVNAGQHVVELAEDFDYTTALPPGFRLATVADLRQAVAAAHHQRVHDPAMSGALRAAGIAGDDLAQVVGGDVVSSELAGVVQVVGGSEPAAGVNALHATLTHESAVGSEPAAGVVQVVEVAKVGDAHTAQDAHVAHPGRPDAGRPDDRGVLLERAGHADERAGDPTGALEFAAATLARAMQPQPPPTPGVRVLTGPSVGELASATFRKPGER